MFVVGHLVENSFQVKCPLWTIPVHSGHTYWAECTLM